jgi:hypothetical protein
MDAVQNACENPGAVAEKPKAPKPPKNKGGNGKITKHDAEKLLTAAVTATLAAQGGPPVTKGDAIQAQRREELGISERAAEWVRKSCGLAPEEFRARLAERMEAVIAQIIVRLEERVGDMAPRDLPFAFGILNDHLMKTRGFGAPITLHQTNIQIQGMDRTNALAMITGKRSAADGHTPKPVRTSRPAAPSVPISGPLDAGSVNDADPQPDAVNVEAMPVDEVTLGASAHSPTDNR